MTELWADIKGYEGLYQISTIGRIKGLKSGIITTGETNKKGYKQKALYKNGKEKKYYVHRLVAITFIKNIENLSEINHEDGNKSNNNINNLKWCDRSYNNKHRFTVLKHKHPMLGKKGKLHGGSKKVKQLDLNGNFNKLWDSIMDAQRELGINGSHISGCCKGKLKQTGGYKWQYV